MDLHTVETYLRPTEIGSVSTWEPGWAWLAGGTWLFSEPQPTLNTLIDLERLNWAEIEVGQDHIAIGATCTLTQLINHPWNNDWQATAAFKAAVSALAASFKVTHLATIGGNLCLALAVGVMAPLMVLLDATYEIWHPQFEPRFIAASDFQLGVQKTALKPGEVLRRISIPQAAMLWKTNVQRFGIAATDPALSLVMAAFDPIHSKVRLSLGACVPAPHLLEFNGFPTTAEVFEKLRSVNWLQDARASAVYRQQMTEVLISRALRSLQTQ